MPAAAFRLFLAICFLILTAAPGKADGLADLRMALDRLAPGNWLELDGSADGKIKGTAIARVFPRPNGHPAWGVMGPQAVIVAWSGGAYDTKRNRLVVTGGGHTDYGGNEVYAFDLPSRRWLRLTEPSRYDRLANGKFATVDGTPVSRHTYDGISYLPKLDAVFMYGGGSFRDGARDDAAAWLFDPQRRVWRRKAAAPVGAYPASAYDEASDRVLVTDATSLYAYEVATNRWKVLSSAGPAYENGVAAFDPVRRRYVELRPAGVFHYDLAREAGSLMQIRRSRTSGDEGIEKTPHPGMAYDPISGCILAWAGGPAVWSLDTGSFRWTRHNPPTGPDARSRRGSRGVFGRWRYVPDLDAFIGFNDPQGNVWLFRPQR